MSNGVYTLFDDDGYVIAAVVVGEDAGTTTNLVYAHTGNLESESYDKTTEEYTWVRKVISDGKEIEITEVGDSLSELKSMSQYNWYEVKYLADGTVKSVELAASALYDVVSPDEYVDVIDDLDAAMADHKVVLYEASDYREAAHVNNDLTTQPSVEGRTFYVDTTAQKGFRVDDDVQIVFIQTNNKETVSYESGYQRLEKVIDRLHDSDRGVGGYNFEVSAIMDNYGASVVVIRDLNEAGAIVTPPTGNGNTFVNLVCNPTTIYYIWDEDKISQPSEETALAEIIAELESAGNIVKNVSKSGNTYTFQLSRMVGNTEVAQDNREWNVATDFLQGSVVTINGTKYLVDERNDEYGQIMAELGLAEYGDGVKLANGTFVDFDTASAIDLTDAVADSFTVGTSTATGYYAFTLTNSGSWGAVAGVTYPIAVQNGEKFTVDVTLLSGPGVWTLTGNEAYFTGATVSNVTVDGVTQVQAGTATDTAIVRVALTVNAAGSASYTCP